MCNQGNLEMNEKEATTLTKPMLSQDNDEEEFVKTLECIKELSDAELEKQLREIETFAHHLKVREEQELLRCKEFKILEQVPDS